MKELIYELRMLWAVTLLDWLMAMLPNEREGIVFAQHIASLKDRLNGDEAIIHYPAVPMERKS